MKTQAAATALLLAVTVAAPALAEEGAGGRGIVLSVGAGGFSPLTNLDPAGSADFKTGFNANGSVAYRVNDYVALRGNFALARAEARSLGGSPAGFLPGAKYNRFLYDGDVQLRYPLPSGAAPYLFVGGGAVTVKPDVTPDRDSFTKGAGKVGVGLMYQIPRSNVGLYVEGAGWIYKWDREGFDRTQFDTTWSGGLSYRFGF